MNPKICAKTRGKTMELKMPGQDRPPTGHNRRGGNREGAGRPRGPTAVKQLCELAQSRTAQALETMAAMMNDESKNMVKGQNAMNPYRHGSSHYDLKIRIVGAQLKVENRPCSRTTVNFDLFASPESTYYCVAGLTYVPALIKLA